MTTFDDYCYEPDEIEEIILELKDRLREGVKEEIETELQRLRAENERMHTIVQDYDNKVLELELEKQNYRRELKRERLQVLLSDFTTEMWTVKCTYIELPKCDKCDEHRQRKFISPLGREMWEKCTCAETTRHYVVTEAECVSFRLNTDSGKIVGWYRLRENDFYSGDYGPKYIYDGKPFDEIKEYHTYFKDKQKA